MPIMPKGYYSDDYRGFLYEFSTNVTYLVSKIFCLLSTRLKLAIIDLKDTHEGNELILRRSSMKLPFCPFGDKFLF